MRVKSPTWGTAIGLFVTGSMYDDRGFSTSGDADLGRAPAPFTLTLAGGGWLVASLSETLAGSCGEIEPLVSLAKGDPARCGGVSAAAVASTDGGRGDTDGGFGDLDVDLRPLESL